MVSLNLDFIQINPANLIGQLHLTAVKKVREEYGDKVTIKNSAIDTRDEKDPKAILKNGEYELFFKMDKKDMSEKKMLEIVTKYLEVFSGPENAKKVNQRKGTWWQRLFHMGSSKSDLQKAMTREGSSVMFKIKYKLNIKNGNEQDYSEFDESEKEVSNNETTNNESLEVSLDLELLGESLTFNPYRQYAFTKQQIIEESMKNKSEKLVKHIANKNFVKAQEVLEALIKAKVNERVEEVLSQNSK